jgi:predicted transcriptional regulator
MSDEETNEEAQEKLLIPMKAEDVMATEIVTLDENTIVKKAAEVMVQTGVSAVIVTGEGKANGILTERDKTSERQK